MKQGMKIEFQEKKMRTTGSSSYKYSRHGHMVHLQKKSNVQIIWNDLENDNDEKETNKWLVANKST